MVGEIVALFDLNNDGKIDYLEFEAFLNQQFPDVDKEESLYAGLLLFFVTPKFF